MKRKVSKALKAKLAKNLKKAQKAAQSPEARAKRIATFKRNRAERMAQAQQEFQPIVQSTDIPLHAIPARAPRVPAPRKPSPTFNIPGTAFMVTPEGDVQIVMGKTRITIERR